MKCLSNEELKNLYNGNIDNELTKTIYHHMASCSDCSQRYFEIAEENSASFHIDVSALVMKQIHKTPISRRKLLAIYAVAAACSFIVIMTGSMDKIMRLSSQIQRETTLFSQKFNDSKINQYWEDMTHGIQN